MHNNNGRGKCYQPSRRSRLITLTLFVVVVVVAANPVNMNTEGTTESVPINGESVLSGSCY